MWAYDQPITQPTFDQYISSDKPGLWSYTALADKINAYSNVCSIQLNKTTGKITLTVYPNYAIIFSSRLAKMLCISSTNAVTRPTPFYPGLTLTLMKFTAGTYTSTTAINLALYKTLNVMLEQISTETSKYNGATTTVLDVIDVETSNFGDIVTVIRELPCCKLLRGGLID